MVRQGSSKVSERREERGRDKGRRRRRLRAVRRSGAIWSDPPRRAFEKCGCAQATLRGHARGPPPPLLKHSPLHRFAVLTILFTGVPRRRLAAQSGQRGGARVRVCSRARAQRRRPQRRPPPAARAVVGRPARALAARRPAARRRARRTRPPAPEAVDVRCGGRLQGVALGGAGGGLAGGPLEPSGRDRPPLPAVHAGENPPFCVCARW